jgi:hypothetical protein
MLARLAAAPGGDDRFLLAAVLSSLNGKNVQAVAAAVTAGARERTPSPALLAGLFRTAIGTKNMSAIASTLQSFTTPQGDAYAPWQYQTLANLLDSLDSSGTSLKKLAEADKSLATTVDAVGAVVSAARRTANDAAAPIELRAAAVALLGRDRASQAEDLKTFDRLLSPQSPRELQAAAIGTLGRRKDAQSAKLLLAHWKGMTPELRSAVLDGLLARPDSANQLLDAIESKSVLAIEVDAPRRQRLLQFPDKGVRTRAATLFAESVNPNRQKVIDTFADALTLKGDVKNGQAVFAKTCATCHRLGDPPVGNAVGPDLASVGDKSPDGLLVAILDPNRAVEPRFIRYYPVPCPPHSRSSRTRMTPRSSVPAR